MTEQEMYQFGPIIVARRTNDYRAYVRGDEQAWAAGESVHEAIRVLVAVHLDLLASRATADRAELEALREARRLLETGPDEPLMTDPSSPGFSRYTFWFCGGTTRKGHAADCPWEALVAALAAAAAPTAERRPADDGDGGA